MASWDFLKKIISQTSSKDKAQEISLNKYGTASLIAGDNGSSQWVNVTYGTHCSVCERYFNYEERQRVQGHSWCLACKTSFESMMEKI